MKPLHEWTRNEMQTFFKNSNLKSRVFFIVCILWIILCYYIHKHTTNADLKSNLIELFFTSIIIWKMFTLMPLVNRLNNTKRIDQIKDDKIGNYSKAEIQELFLEVLAFSERKEKPTIYILDSEECNAFAINIYFLNFIQLFNSISISREFFYHLNKDEIKAILLHEMGHFNGYIYAENKVVNLFQSFFFIMPFAFNCFFDGWLTKTIVAIIVLIVISKIFMAIRNKNQQGEHALEYLSDLYSADRVGGIHMINALIVLGRLIEKKNNEKPTKVIEKAKDKIVPERKLVNWKEFDNVVVNGKIEREEYDSFIATLNNTLNPQLLTNNVVDETSFSHPSLTERIMFIHKNSKKIS